MPGIVKHVDICRHRLRGDAKRVLRAVPRPVDFAVVVDQMRHLDLPGTRAVPTDLAALVVLTRVNVSVLQGELELLEREEERVRRSARREEVLSHQNKKQKNGCDSSKIKIGAKRANLASGAWHLRVACVALRGAVLCSWDMIKPRDPIGVVPEPPQSSSGSVRFPRCASPRSASAWSNLCPGPRLGRGATAR